MDAASPAKSAPVIALSGLRLEVRQGVLLDNASLTLERGKLALLVGPSGAGKSLLLRVLAGLEAGLGAGVTINGELSLDGRQVRSGATPSRDRDAFRGCALVLQNQALFDEQSVAENLSFARDHSPSSTAEAALAKAQAFLTTAGISGDRSTAELSGGQRQRVAIARAIAYDAPLFVYDEPTSALDPRSSRGVAELIARSRADFQKTALVVTHDYEPFEGLADQVFYLDPQAKSLREIDFEELDAVMREARVDELRGGDVEAASERRRSPLAALEALLTATGSTALALSGQLPWLIPWRGRRRWLWHSTRHFSRLCFWGSAVPYMLIAGAIVGFVVNYFTFTRLPQGRHFQDEILPVVGVALYRVVIPVLTTLLVAGRTGAALASELGNRVLGQQVLAMRSFGVDERAYLLSPMLFTNALGTVLLNLLAFASASVTGLVVFTLAVPGRSPFFWSSYYFEKLSASPWPTDSGLVLAKLLCCSLVISGVAYGVGSEAKRSGAEVSFATTKTVYWGTVGVLLVHFIFAFAEFGGEAT